MRFGSGVPVSEKWQKLTLDLYNALKINNAVESVDRSIRRFFKHESSLLNTIFMKRLPSTKSAQTIICKHIRQNDILSIRFGLYEYQLCYQYLEKKVGIRREYSDFIIYHIKNDAGICWNDMSELDDYAKFIIENIDLANIITYWRNYPPKIVFNRFYKKGVFHINVEDLYPYPFWHKRNLPSWQMLLKGKKVLIVTSFSETVNKQYKNRSNIWKDADIILPEFDMVTFQSICTNGGKSDERFSSWKESVLYMRNEILKKDFDIALISCGGYGMPLALELKKEGKNVIQWGGCYQLWFGIKGARWETESCIKDYFNEYWTYPSMAETPPNASRVNNSCYWKK